MISVYSVLNLFHFPLGTHHFVYAATGGLGGIAMTQDKPQGFYIGSWGTWGWIETILKVIAAGFGIAAFAATSGAGDLSSAAIRNYWRCS